MKYYVKKVNNSYFGYGVFMVGFHYPIIENITLLKAHQEVDRKINKKLMLNESKLGNNGEYKVILGSIENETTKNLRINSEAETVILLNDEDLITNNFYEDFEKIRSSIRTDIKGY